MHEVTDRHFRMLVRCVSKLPTVWTEMTWAHAIVDAPAPERLIGFSPAEHPIVLQLGGGDPTYLAQAAAIGAQRGYDGINLNCGCPAGDRGEAQRNYGARLMKSPSHVADCCSAMRRSLMACGHGHVELSVKCRLGVDGRETYEELCEFITTVHTHGGVSHFVVHARHALLGLNAAQNRAVPPLRYEWVYRLIESFPHISFTINGGVTTLEQAAKLLQRGVKGVMIGRQGVVEPHLFAKSDLLLSSLPGQGGPALGEEEGRSRREVLSAYLEYATRAQAENVGGGNVETLARALLSPLSGLFYDSPSGPKWRTALNMAVQARDDLRALPVGEIVRKCLATCGVPEQILDARPSLACTPTAANRHEAKCHEAKFHEQEAGGDGSHWEGAAGGELPRRGADTEEADDEWRQRQTLRVSRLPSSWLRGRRPVQADEIAPSSTSSSSQTPRELLCAAAAPFGFASAESVVILHAARAALLQMDSPAAADAMLAYHADTPLVLGGRPVVLERSAQRVRTPSGLQL